MVRNSQAFFDWLATKAHITLIFHLSSPEMLSLDIVELRYSLNGVTESQMRLLFNILEKNSSQVIMKRVNAAQALSADDIILEGVVSTDLVTQLARGFPPPLSFKVESNQDLYPRLRSYCSFEWQNNPTLLCGVSMLPFVALQTMLTFDSPWQLLRLITSSQAGSILKPLLVVKPKGLLVISRNQVNFVMPMHRIDFLVKWLEYITHNDATVNWLSGSTGELVPELVEAIGSVDVNKIPTLESLLSQTSSDQDLDFSLLFKKALVATEF